MVIRTNPVTIFVTALVVILSGCAPESVPTSPTGVAPTQPPQVPSPTRVLEPFATHIRIRDGMTLVYVPAGQFEMGSNVDERARPVHTVTLDAYWIDQTEVTNKMFATILNEKGN